jgi:hypothetical protein
MRLSFGDSPFLPGLVLCAWVLSGCATTSPPPSPELRSQLGRVAIVAGPTAPAGEFHTFAKGLAEGTAKGAAGGALQGLAHAFSAGAGGGGAYAGAAATIAAVIFAGVGAAVGAVVGHQAAIPAETTRWIEARIDAVLRGLNLSQAVAEAIRREGGTRPEVAGRLAAPPAGDEPFSALAAQGIDTVLEVTIPAIGFQGGEGENPLIALYVRGRTRLIRT